MLSAAFAVTIAYLALRGLNDYRTLKTKLSEEVHNDVTAAIVERLINETLAQLRTRVQAGTAEIEKAALDAAALRLRTELKRYAEETAERTDFIEEVTRSVVAKLQPKAKETNQHEFE